MGGFAEYVAVPGYMAFALPEELSLEESSVIGCRVTTAYNAVKHGAELAPGDSLSLQALLGKSLDLLLTGGPPVVNAYLRGAKIKIIGGVTNLLPYMFLASGSIKAAEQLKGKKIGIARFGSSTRTHSMLYMWANSPYKTIHDVRNAAVPPKCGATATGNTGYYLPKLLEQTIGTKFNLVTGYQGGTDIELAVERGEVECRAFTVQVFFGREPFHIWRSKGLVRVLVQTGQKRDARLPDVPTLHELMDQYQTSDANRRLATVMLGSGEFGSSPTISSRGVPEEQLKTLRAAFAKALNSADLVAEAKKRGLEPELISGEELESLAKEVIVQPSEVIGLIKKVMGE